jgi:hypothetical protein
LLAEEEVWWEDGAEAGGGGGAGSRKVKVRLREVKRGVGRMEIEGHSIQALLARKASSVGEGEGEEGAAGSEEEVGADAGLSVLARGADIDSGPG